jgi:hypothetical protein
MYKKYYNYLKTLGGRLPWTGEWPGVAECRELGLYSYFVPNGNPPWVPCRKDHPEAGEDLNELHRYMYWDNKQRKYVKKSTAYTLLERRNRAIMEAEAKEAEYGQ